MLAEFRKALCKLGRLFLSVILETSLQGPSFQKKLRISAFSSRMSQIDYVKTNGIPSRDEE